MWVIESSAVPVGAIAYLAACALALRPAYFRFTASALIVGIVAFCIAIAARWLHYGQGPFLTLYEVLLSNCFSLGLVSAVILLCSQNSRAAVFPSTVVLSLLAVWLLLTDDRSVPLPPTFANYWLWVHVLFGKFFLGFLLMGAGLAIVQLASLAALDLKETNQGERLLWQFLGWAFVCHSGMLVAGSAWAHEAWGRFWAWDPLEVWSLLTWLLLGVLLHLRITVRLPPYLGWSGVLLVFAVAFLTFFGVPFLSVAPHRGAF